MRVGENAELKSVSASALLKYSPEKHSSRLLLYPRGDVAERQVTPSPDYIRTSVTTRSRSPSSQLPTLTCPVA